MHYPYFYYNPGCGFFFFCIKAKEQRKKINGIAIMKNNNNK
jgi:hypothetical protein